MRLASTAEMSLAVTQIEKRGLGNEVWLTRIVDGTHLRVIGARSGPEFHPIDVVAETPATGLYPVAIESALPAGLSGRDHMAVLDLARKAGKLLPQGVGLIAMEVVLADGDPLLVDAAPLWRVPRGLSAIFLHAYGIDLDQERFKLAAGDDPDFNASRDLASVVRWIEHAKAKPDYPTFLRTASEHDHSAEPYSGNTESHPGGHVADEHEREQLGYIVSAAPTRDSATATIHDVCGP